MFICIHLSKKKKQKKFKIKKGPKGRKFKIEQQTHTSLSQFRSSEKPDVPEQQEDGRDEGEPDTPADAGPTGHAQHPVHRRPESDARALERVVHLLGQGGRVADLVADGERYLFPY